MDTTFMFCLLVAFICIVDARHHHKCAADHYRDPHTRKCTKCSSCPVNQIIRRPCHKHKDTVCGYFVEFDKFHQGIKTMDAESKIENGDVEMVAVTTEPQNPDDFFTLETLENDGYWKTLSMALIGLLCVVSVILIVFVLVTCKIKKRQQIQEKEFHYGTEALPSEYAGLFSTRTPIYEPSPREERYVEFPIHTALNNVSQIYTPTTEGIESSRRASSSQEYIAFAPTD